MTSLSLELDRQVCFLSIRAAPFASDWGGRQVGVKSMQVAMQDAEDRVLRAFGATFGVRLVESGAL